ncbi:RNA polymerase sigma factor [Nocardia wallacei]|uniref:RNA polymerase sigma factor n=1 Tax=Nocardia wallacei TaxID=480035 RepID=UPI00245852AE|nr:sigma-70 family RNA polymerase sigma factor [Nocardia wallacei]
MTDDPEQQQTDELYFAAAQSASAISPIDVAAFKMFYESFVEDLALFLVWQGARVADAAEIAQETMIQAWQSWSGIQHPRAWARKVAGRALARRIGSVREDPVLELPEQSALLREHPDFDAWEQRHDILRALAKLPPRQRQVMAWTLEEYTPSEIAEILRIEPDAVRANLRKARRALAIHMKGGED